MKAQHDLSKLPLWAQRRIQVLEANLAHTQARLAVGPEDSDVFADPYSPTKRPLGHGTCIEFVMPDGPYRKITVDPQHGRLYVNGSHLLDIRPVAANAIEIRLEKR